MVSLKDSLMPMSSLSPREKDADDVYVSARMAEQDESEKTPFTKVKNLPPAFMFNLSGFDPSSLARQKQGYKKRDSAPSTNNSEEDNELRKWVTSVDPSIELNNVYGTVTRSDIPSERPYKLLLQ